MNKIYNIKRLRFKRRKLRNNMTEPEMKLWFHLRGGRLGVKFRRQFSVRNYVVDFYSPKLKLAIEIDGDSHFSESGQHKDRERDAYLLEKGIRVLRFLNTDISENMPGVLERIQEQIIIPPPTGSPDGEPPLLNLPLTKGEKERG